MPNKNYIKGVKKERKIVNEARAKGLTAFRSAGSHSPIDVVVIDMKLKKILFYQCKPDNFSVRETVRILDKMNDLSGGYEVYFDVV